MGITRRDTFYSWINSPDHSLGIKKKIISDTPPASSGNFLNVDLGAHCSRNTWRSPDASAQCLADIYCQPDRPGSEKTPAVMMKNATSGMLGTRKRGPLFWTHLYPFLSSQPHGAETDVLPP